MKQSTITKKLKRLIIFSVEDFDTSYIERIHYSKLTGIYNVIVLNAFFIQTFNKYNINNEFEILEIYWNKDSKLSVYIKHNNNTVHE